jgi:hypothetical protein
LENKEDKKIFNDIVLSKNENELPILMAALGYAQNEEICPIGHLIPHPLGQMQISHEPSFRAWGDSIVYPEKYGRDTDLWSSPQKYGAGPTQPCRLGERGAVDPVTRQIWLEIRTDEHVPLEIPANDMETNMMLRYMLYQKYNPYLHQVPFENVDNFRVEGSDEYRRLGNYKFFVELYHEMDSFKNFANMFAERATVVDGENTVFLVAAKQYLSNHLEHFKNNVEQMEEFMKYEDCLKDEKVSKDLLPYIQNFKDSLSTLDEYSTVDAEIAKKQYTVLFSRAELFQRNLYDAFPELSKRLFEKEYEVWNAAATEG